MHIPKDQWEQLYILILYVDDILLASNDFGMLRTTKDFLSKNFEMKDLRQATYVVGIEIYRNRSQGILGLSQKSYNEKILEKFNMGNCSSVLLQSGKVTNSLKSNVRKIKWSKIRWQKYHTKLIGYSDSDFAGCVTLLLYLQ